MDMQTKGHLPLDPGMFGVSSTAFITFLVQWCVLYLTNPLPVSKSIKLGSKAQIIIYCLSCALKRMDQVLDST